MPRNAQGFALLPSLQSSSGIPRCRNGSAAWSWVPHPLGHAPRAAVAPSVLAGLRHAGHACHYGDRKVGPIRVHEPEDPEGATPVSRANQAAARGRMYGSRRSCLFSRRNRFNSSRSAALRPTSPSEFRNLPGRITPGARPLDQVPPDLRRIRWMRLGHKDTSRKNLGGVHQIGATSNSHHINSLLRQVRRPPIFLHFMQHNQPMTTVPPSTIVPNISQAT